MVRCFVGIFLPDDLKSKIVNIQNFVKGLPIECKLVEPRNLHITLSFLGELSDMEIASVSEKLDSISNRFEWFPLTVSGIMFIPSRNYIRVLALNVADGNVPNELSSNIKSVIGGDVKPPHLTICRVNKISNKSAAVEKLSNIDSFVGEFRVGSIHLMSSELRRGGPIYTTIHESRLKT